MSPISLSKEARLEDAIYALSLAKDLPDADVLDSVVKDYPEFANELTDFAIALVVDTLDNADEVIEAPGDNSVQDDAVTSAISRFQNKLFQRKAQDNLTIKSQKPIRPGAANPFAELNRPQYRDLIQKLGANTIFVNKLRDHQVDGSTITHGFKARLADDMHVPIEVIVAHFASEVGGSARQMYKASVKPSTGSLESFREAVRNSGLSHEQQQALLAL